ncbi:uncharacterized protein [Rutidosis leptorrhynchoides]|uniref:uncharacterized protein n=1 Tax=Rutidosis leptorrhynchoides TaxID=125765 RepID=UPI003A9926C1
MTEEGKNRAVAYSGDQHPSAPPQPPPPYNYYGTFQGVANYPQPQQPYHPPPPPPPALGFPQPSPPHTHPYYSHGYQTVPGIVIAPGAPVLIERRTLPCCGCGIGWFLFFAGFFFGAIPWYIGAFILLFVRVDYREKAGLVACTIALHNPPLTTTLEETWTNPRAWPVTPLTKKEVLELVNEIAQQPKLVEEQALKLTKDLNHKIQSVEHLLHSVKNLIA